MQSWFGILNIDKPAGWSSRDVVARIHRMVKPSKAGHAGTLDPLATGVLVIGLGSATRLVENVQSMPKHYSATFLLGQSSESDDTEREITFLENPPQPTREQLQAMLPQFTGEIDQVPPKFSAVKIGGQRAYKLARKGEKVEIKSRCVRISLLEIKRYEYPELELDMVCSSGTYVRSLGRDLAIALGTAAVMSKLRRTAIGHFTAEKSLPIESITEETLAKQILPAQEAVPNLPQRIITPKEAADLVNGVPMPLAEIDKNQAEQTLIAAIDTNNRLHALMQLKEDGLLWPKRYFPL